MSPLRDLYAPSLALLTDLYQVTMAYGYWKAGLTEREAAFHLFYRSNPFGGGYTVACGLAHVVEFLDEFRFADSDLAYLADLRGNDDRPLFDAAFMEHLRDMRLTCEIDAVPEGTVMFEHEPLMRVTGPIVQCQLLETPLLTLTNFPTLIATKAARVALAAGDDPVLEFGLRRAQGVDGGVTASRAAYVGGCAATSNVLAGKHYGIPVKGTHAHSWVMCFDSELASFETYAEVLPNNCIFLVDTYDTLEGVRRAVQVGHELRERGHEMLGVRLDSGDLAYLSIEARKILDEGGFPDAKIVASNNLDEHLINSLKQQNAKIDIWGVGTKLATAYDQPALGGVYKLSAVRDPGRAWQYRVKLSEQKSKIPTPGVLQVRRYRHDGGECLADAVVDVEQPPAGACTIVDPLDTTRRKTLAADKPFEELLVPVYRDERVVYESPALEQSRERTRQQLASFHAGVKRFENPHRYPAGLELGLHKRREQLILVARGVKEA